MRTSLVVIFLVGDAINFRRHSGVKRARTTCKAGAHSEGGQTGRVAPLAPERFAKTLWTDRPHGALPVLLTVADDADQARYVASRVLLNREAGGDGARILRTCRARSAASSGANVSPALPIVSGSAAALAATTGVPQAIASTTGMQKPSCTDGMTRTLASR